MIRREGISLFRAICTRARQPYRLIARRAAILKPGVLRAVDLYRFAQAIAPPARLMRRGHTTPTVCVTTRRTPISQNGEGDMQFPLATCHHFLGLLQSVVAGEVGAIPVAQSSRRRAW
jgi:hypothetical protein